MKENSKEPRIAMATINGVIMGLIGFLMLITPLVAEVAADKIKIDIIAGGVLLAGGFVSLILGLRRKQ
jgi:hypothetical protein